MLGKLFRQKAQQAQASAAKFENRDLMEAVVGGALLIAAADGEIEDSELESLDKLIQTNEKLAHFGSEISSTINRFHGMLDASFRMGKVKILREIADINSDEEAKEEAFVTMVAIAEADGEIDSDEEAVLTEIGRKMGINVKEYGLG